jgi:hypothetical protein
VLSDELLLDFLLSESEEPSDDEEEEEEVPSSPLDESSSSSSSFEEDNLEILFFCFFVFVSLSADLDVFFLFFSNCAVYSIT